MLRRLRSLYLLLRCFFRWRRLQRYRHRSVILNMNLHVRTELSIYVKIIEKGFSTTRIICRSQPFHFHNQYREQSYTSEEML